MLHVRHAPMYKSVPSSENQQRQISNGNRTEWSSIRSVIIRVITKSDDRAAGVRFVYHEYDYRPNRRNALSAQALPIWREREAY